MNRTRLLLGAVVGVVGIAILTGLGSAAPREMAAGAAGRPNIVVILADDERFDSMGQMPNVRRLIANRGVTFSHAFTTTSECCPSRA